MYGRNNKRNKVTLDDKGWQSIPMNYRLNRNISYILPIIDLIKMKEKIQIAKMRAVLLYIMQSFPHGVEFIKLFKILYFAQIWESAYRRLF